MSIFSSCHRIPLKVYTLEHFLIEHTTSEQILFLVGIINLLKHSFTHQLSILLLTLIPHLLLASCLLIFWNVNYSVLQLGGGSSHTWCYYGLLTSSTLKFFFFGENNSKQSKSKFRRLFLSDRVLSTSEIYSSFAT